MAKVLLLRPSSLSRTKTRARPAPVDRGGPSASDPSTQTSRPVRSDPPIAARDRSKTRRAPFHPSRSRVKFQLRLGEWIIHPTSRTRRYYARPCAPDRDPLLPFPTTQRERRIIRDRPLTDARSFPDAHDQVRARIPVSLRPDAPTPASVRFYSIPFVVSSRVSDPEKGPHVHRADVRSRHPARGKHGHHARRAPPARHSRPRRSVPRQVPPPGASTRRDVLWRPAAPDEGAGGLRAWHSSWCPRHGKCTSARGTTATRRP